MKYRKGFKYQVAAVEAIEVEWLKGYEIELDFISLCDGRLVAKNGYAFDGPSGPAIDTDNFMTPALFHDIGYQLMRLGLLPQSFRKKFDLLLESMSKDRGMSWVRRKYVLFGVRRYAAKAASTDSVKKIYTVP